MSWDFLSVASVGQGPQQIGWLILLEAIVVGAAVVYRERETNRESRDKLMPLSDEEFFSDPEFQRCGVPREFVLRARRHIEQQLVLSRQLGNKLRPNMTMADIKKLEDAAHEGLWMDAAYDDLVESGINPCVLFERSTIAQIIVAVWNSKAREKW